MKARRIRFIICSLIVIGFVWLDQWTKSLAVQYLKGNEAVPIWEGVFELTYLENRGAAFGIMQGKHSVFLVIAAVILALILYILYKMPEGKRYMPLTVSLSFICAGAVGNVIDRMVQGYVVDFLYFSLIDFPVFNVADIYVTVASAVVIVLIWFFYKEDEFHFFG